MPAPVALIAVTGPNLIGDGEGDETYPSSSRGLFRGDSEDMAYTARYQNCQKYLMGEKT